MIIQELIETSQNTSLQVCESLYNDMVEHCLMLMENYISDYTSNIASPNFELFMKHDVKKMFDVQYMPLCIPNKLFPQPTLSEHAQQIYDFESMFDMIYDYCSSVFYSTIMPKRSFTTTFVRIRPNKYIIDEKIAYLKSIPQPEQRTKAWYHFRHNLITASNAYKVFESVKVQNQLICEKCKPLIQDTDDIKTNNDENEEKSGKTEKTEKQDESNTSCEKPLSEQPKPQVTVSINMASPLHWGQKYEDVAIMIYENYYKTQIHDFGCIKHNAYPFLGASPDGICVDPSSPIYGRMLEIKCVVSRELNGIPKKEYWTQMQLQMEVCNLNECDFLETKFVEYESEEDFINDGGFLQEGFTNPCWSLTNSNRCGNNMSRVYTQGRKIDSYLKTKGAMLCFIVNQYPKYYYAPLFITEDAYNKWRSDIIEKMEADGHTYLRSIYWYIDDISCVLVLRNKHWFKKMIPKMQIFWNMILHERLYGYSHRLPTPRVKKPSIPQQVTDDKIDKSLFEDTKCDADAVPIQLKSKTIHPHTQCVDTMTLDMALLSDYNDDKSDESHPTNDSNDSNDSTDIINDLPVFKNTRSRSNTQVSE